MLRRWKSCIVQCAWHKFRNHKSKHVSLTFLLKLYHGTVFPTAMSLLASLPLTQKCLHKLDVVQGRMLESIGGYVRIADEP